MYGIKDLDYIDEKSIELRFPVLIRNVFIWMSFALAFTGLTAYGIAQSPSVIEIFRSNSFFIWGLFIAEIVLVLLISAGINNFSMKQATLLFILYSLINGVTLSVIFLTYTMSSIASTFFISAGTFGMMAVFGFVTKTDLTSMGKLLLMALLGIILATIINMFLHYSIVDMICSYVGVFIFIGLTAYDTQKLKELLIDTDEGSETHQKIALLGALTLYLDFINLFLYILRLFGRRK